MTEAQIWKDELYDRLESHVDDLNSIAEDEIVEWQLLQFAWYTNSIAHQLFSIIEKFSKNNKTIDKIDDWYKEWNHGFKEHATGVLALSILLQKDVDKDIIEQNMYDLRMIANITKRKIKNLKDKNFPEKHVITPIEFEDFINTHFFDIWVRWNIENDFTLNQSNHELYETIQELGINYRDYWKKWTGEIQICADKNCIKFELKNKKSEQLPKKRWWHWLKLIKYYFPAKNFTYDYSWEDCVSYLLIPASIDIDSTLELSSDAAAA